MYIEITVSPCILGPLHQPQNVGLKLEVVLEWRDIYVENIKIVSLIRRVIAGLKNGGKC